MSSISISSKSGSYRDVVQVQRKQAAPDEAGRRKSPTRKIADQHTGRHGYPGSSPRTHVGLQEYQHHRLLQGLQRKDEGHQRGHTTTDQGARQPGPQLSDIHYETSVHVLPETGGGYTEGFHESAEGGGRYGDAKARVRDSEDKTDRREPGVQEPGRSVQYVDLHRPIVGHQSGQGPESGRVSTILGRQKSRARGAETGVARAERSENVKDGMSGLVDYNIYNYC